MLINQISCGYEIQNTFNCDKLKPDGLTIFSWFTNVIAKKKCNNKNYNV